MCSRVWRMTPRHPRVRGLLRSDDAVTLPAKISRHPILPDSSHSESLGIWDLRQEPKDSRHYDALHSHGERRHHRRLGGILVPLPPKAVIAHPTQVA